jgi:hypothetical protein|tara:strand:- start:13 stop:402 length:390 start_codon:yes stop_codon:yes gene_type:complete
MKDETVYHCKLSNGDEVFGQIEQTDLGLTIHQPMSLSDYGDEGGDAVGLYSYMPFSEEQSCTIHWEHVMSFNKVLPVVEEFFHLSRHFAERSIIKQLENIQFGNQQMKQYIEEDQLDSISTNQSSLLIH